MQQLALITGGHHSLGLAIAKEFAKSDYNLIITYHTKEDLALKTREELMNTYHINVDIFPVDLSREEETYNFTKLVKEKYSSLNVIINNAAYTVEEEFSKKNISDFSKILTVNTIAPFILTKELSSILSDNSAVTNISSTNGIDTYSPLTLEYDASKSALINLTHNLAIALSPKTRVNAVAPGWISTDSTNSMNPLYKETEKSKILLNRFAPPEEIASVVFAVSTQFTYMNDAIIRLDGGVNNAR